MEPRILVPLDGSLHAEQALPFAQAIAGPARQLVLLEVGQEPEDAFTVHEQHGGSGAQLKTVIGDPAEQILRVAHDLSVGMIVMTTHGRGALGRLALGSVADEVARTSPVPVMVIRPTNGMTHEPPLPIQRLIVPLDGSALAEQALPVAKVLAEWLQLPVHLLTVIGSTNAVMLEVTLAAFDAAHFQESIDELFTEAGERLARHAERLQQAGLTVTWEVLRGSPYFAIAEAARPGDTIVMVSHRRHGVERWVLGSVAEKLIREGPVPVILVPTGSQPDAVPSEAPAGREIDLVSR